MDQINLMSKNYEINNLNFQSRSKRLENIKFEESNEKQFILKITDNGYYFDKSQYNFIFFKKYLNQFIFNIFIDSVNKIIHKQLVKKYKYENKDPFKNAKRISYFNLIILLLSYLISVIIYFFIPNVIIIYLGIIISGLTMFLILISIIITLLVKDNFFFLEKEIYKNLNKYIINKNKAFEKNKNKIKIILDKNFYYIKFIKIDV